MVPETRDALVLNGSRPADSCGMVGVTLLQQGGPPMYGTLVLMAAMASHPSADQAPTSPPAAVIERQTLLTAPPAAAAGIITYDQFMTSGPIEQRLTTFNALCPENRAALVVEQLTRWRKKNAARLTVDQQRFLDEALGMIEPALYSERLPRRPELRETMRVLEQRARKLFEPADVRNSLTLHGDYIPPQ